MNTLLRSITAGVSSSWKDLKTFFLAPPEHMHTDRIRSSLGQFLFMRIMILALFLSASAWESRSDQQLNATLWLLTIVALVSVIQILFLRSAKHIIRAAYVQLCSDVLLATSVLVVTGSLISFSLYLLVIVGAAFVLGGHGAVSIGALCGIAYGLVAGDVIPTPFGPDAFAQLPSLTVVYAMLVFIALLSTKFTRQLEIMGSLAHQHQAALEALSTHHSLLFEDITDGVITVDGDYTIQNINGAARQMLEFYGRESSYPVGCSLFTVLESLGVNDASGAIKGRSQATGPHELLLNTNQSKVEKHIQYSVRHTLNTNGMQSGAIVIFDDVSQVRDIEEKLLVHERMTRLLSESSQPMVSHAYAYGAMIGESQIMTKVFTLVERVADSEASVLITGDSGTGKELIARAIHRGSSRRQKPFVAINCGAIPENLIESELFGHTKGSFTGAVSDTLGLFREAQGGTVFLDEVGELPLNLQAKLLRVLQEKTVRAVGGNKDIAIEVRILAATNRDLKQAILEGKFREDLYYRLNVLNLVIPPLKERKEDIPFLVKHFIGKYCNPDKAVPQISPEAVHYLLGYHYPGNVRELENIIERALVLGGQAILPEHLPTEVLEHKQDGASPKKPVTEVIELPLDLEAVLAGVERKYLSQALVEAEGVKTKAAELLGLNFRSFRYRLKKYGLANTDDGESDAQP